MRQYPKPLAKLIGELARLPGIGYKTAQRLAFHILSLEDGEAAALARDAGVRELWFTHYSPAMLNPKEYLDAARAIFPNAHTGRNLKTTTLRFDEE